MIRYALSAALLIAGLGAAVAAEPTSATTASQLALDIRACNQIAGTTERENCKTNVRNEHTYAVRAPLREPARFERTYN